MAKQNMMIHLEPEQKLALQARAETSGTSVSALIRQAVDEFLDKSTEEELVALDEMSKLAEQEFRRMSARLDDVNAYVDRTLAELERLRGSPVSARAKLSTPTTRAVTS